MCRLFRVTAVTLCVCVCVCVCVACVYVCVCVCAGRLCGTCQEGYGVTLDLQSCNNECDAGLPLFLILCT